MLSLLRRRVGTKCSTRSEEWEMSAQGGDGVPTEVVRYYDVHDKGHLDTTVPVKVLEFRHLESRSLRSYLFNIRTMRLDTLDTTPEVSRFGTRDEDVSSTSRSQR